MENTRALFLIEKSGLNEKDKEFLVKHLELYEEILKTKEINILELKDAIDQGKYLDNLLMNAKKAAVVLSSGNTTKKIESLLKFIENY